MQTVTLISTIVSRWDLKMATPNCRILCVFSSRKRNVFDGAHRTPKPGLPARSQDRSRLPDGVHVVITGSALVMKTPAATSRRRGRGTEVEGEDGARQRNARCSSKMRPTPYGGTGSLRCGRPSQALTCCFRCSVSKVRGQRPSSKAGFPPRTGEGLFFRLSMFT